MKIHQAIAFALCLFTVSPVFSQTTLEGRVLDSESDEALAGVKVYLIGTQSGAYTAEDGTFLIIGLKAGKFDILFSYMGYNPDTLKGFEIKEGIANLLERKLGGQIEMKGVEISAERITVSEIALVKDIQAAKEVVVGISSEQIAKTQDRDASEAMKRVPGVTIMDNRFVMVRGLSQRYNSVMLNGAFAPSLEADVKSFSFDLIPSSAIERIMVYKTPSAELPGEFAGGVVKIFTRNVPEKNSFQINYSSSYRNGTTFQDFYSQQLPKSSFLNLGTQGAELPSGFPTSVKGVTDTAALNQLGRSLPLSWSAVQKTASPDQRLQLNLSRRIPIGKMVLGNISSVSYTSTSSHQQIQRYEYNEYAPEQQRHDTISSFVDAQYNRNARLGVMENLALVINSRNRIEFRNLYNQTTLNQTTLRTGTDFAAGQVLNSGGYYLLNRKVFSSQLTGGHSLMHESLRVDWVAGFGSSSRNEPFVRRYRRVMEMGTDQDGLYETTISARPDPSALGMFYSKMSERSWFASAGIDKKIAIRNSELHLLMGFLGESKTRSFEARNFGYVLSRASTFNWDLSKLSLDSLMQPGNINTVNGLKLSESSKPADSYTGSNRQLAGYAAFDMKFSKLLRVNAGVRVEDNLQVLNSKDNNNDTVNVRNNILRVLPSANVAFLLTEKMLIRTTCGMTVNRPEFREIAPFTFYDFNMNTIYGGNPNLATPSILNLDLRWELYPGLNEMVNVGVFYKSFRNSIEQVVVPGSTSRPFTYSFSNAPSAYSAGAEIEIRKSLASLSKLPVIRDLSVIANASVIQSRVKFDPAIAVQESKRPLQGQSPYIINSGLYYNNDTCGFSISAVYNVIGKRIMVVGFDGFPDVWEMPRHQVDIIVSKRIGKYLTLRASVQDLLNQPMLLMQDADQNGKIERAGKADQVIAKTKPGTYYTAGFVLTF